MGASREPNSASPVQWTTAADGGEIRQACIPPAPAHSRRDNNPYELDRVAAWVVHHGFQRVALQFPDSLLVDAPGAVAALKEQLPRTIKLFILGDSTYGSSSVDEVAADHYAADCIVHVGPSDQQHRGRLPVLFVFGQEPVEACAIAGRFTTELRESGVVGEGADVLNSFALVCDVALQHAAGKLAQALDGALRQSLTFDPGDGCSNVFLAMPAAEADPNAAGLRPRHTDWRFGTLTMASWREAHTGTLALAAAATPEPLRLCGREVRRLKVVRPDSTLTTSSSVPSSTKLETSDGPKMLPVDCGLVLCAAATGSALERRLVLRYGNSRHVWRLDPQSGISEKLSSQSLLLQRYRFVELVKSAAVVGLVLAATGARHAQILADRLEELLRRAGRRTYRFVVGRVTPEKLGNFPDIEIFVSLASPEHFPWDSKEYIAPIASPYELEVAMGAREWTGEYVTDPEELLAAPMPAEGTGPDTMRSVETLGGSSRIKYFDSKDRHRANLSTFSAAPSGTLAPALITDGQHGVAQRYNTDLDALRVGQAAEA